MVVVLFVPDRINRCTPWMMVISVGLEIFTTACQWKIQLTTYLVW